MCYITRTYENHCKRMSMHVKVFSSSDASAAAAAAADKGDYYVRCTYVCFGLKELQLMSLSPYFYMRVT